MHTNTFCKYRKKLLASPRVHLVHGYKPPDMIKTTIVPILKNKCGNLSESSNYRPIALTTIISKVFESV